MTTITLAQIASSHQAAALPALSSPLPENFTFDELRVGDHQSLTHTLTAEDVRTFAAMTGDNNPIHLDPAFASRTPFHTVIAHGMWGASLISTLIGTRMPGPGTICMNQRWQFVRPVHVGDTLTARVSVAVKDPSNQHITLACRCTNQHGDDVITGSAQVLAPQEKVMQPRPASALPALIGRSDRFAALFQRVAGLQAIKVAVVYPCTEGTLRGAMQAAQMGLIVPVFVGPKARIEALALQCHLDISTYRLVDVPTSQEAARTAVSMARQHEVQALMKGCLHADELLDEVLDKTHGLCTARHVSHVFVLDLPSLPRPILISDATLKARGDMETRRHTVQNAIDLAHLLGVAHPKVAILGGAETLDMGTHSSADTASLCAMARNGQITGGVLDGPLSLDNALSLQAALDHGIVSPVAGHADVLVVPALYAGNTITRQLQYLADAQVAGVVMGTRVPVILSSPADGLLATPASCAIALLMTRSRPDDTPAAVQRWLQQG
jgi:phosphate acetyltransferase/phosphate butyryltransferase